MPPDRLLRLTFCTPTRRSCGISDYSALLLEPLRRLLAAGEVRTVEPPQVLRTSSVHALLGWLPDEARYRAFGRALNRVGDGPADLAHIQHQYFFFGGVSPLKNHARAVYASVRVPLVVTVHEIAEAPADAPLAVRAALEAVNRANFLHPAIDALIVHTHADVERLIALGADRPSVFHSVHGVPLPAPMPDKDEARRTLGLEGRRILTLFGFLSAKKGHSSVLDALPYLPHDTTVLFAGGRHPDDRSDYVPQLEARAAPFLASNRLRITGFLPADQIPVVMAATDLAVAPYQQTSGSGSLANLLAYGRAIVAADIEPFREMLRQEPHCMQLWDSREKPQEYAELLTDILEDTGGSRTKLEAGARAYAARHSYARMAEETVKVYDEVLKRRQGV